MRMAGEMCVRTGRNPFISGDRGSLSHFKYDVQQKKTHITDIKSATLFAFFAETLLCFGECGVTH